MANLERIKSHYNAFLQQTRKNTTKTSLSI